MRLLVTGGTGTVGRALASAALARGDAFIAWDRTIYPPDDDAAAEAALDRHAPDALIHAALPSRATGRANEDRLVHEDWTARLARAAARRGVRFVYVSTVMVFTDRARGPFAPDSTPDAVEGYGGAKRRGEQAARAAHPEATIVRLGWQIGDQPGGNNMLTFFDDRMREEGRVRASTRWLPATSFLADTAAALIDAAQAAPGIYHLDANTRWSFFDIARALSAAHGNRWIVEPTDAFVYDQRMTDPRISLPALDRRLPELARIAS